MNWITFSTRIFWHSFWHSWFTQGCLNQGYRWLYNKPKLIHFNLITMKDIHEVSNCTFSTQLSGVLHWKKKYFLCNFVNQICLIDVAYLKQFFYWNGRKKSVDFCFLGVESSIENCFKSPKSTKFFFLSCFPFNHSLFIFHINFNNTSLVWSLITMIFDNNKVTNLQTFFRQ